MTLAEAEAVLARFRYDPTGPLYHVTHTFEAVNEVARAIKVKKAHDAR
jgi:hypothetical protein